MLEHVFRRAVVRARIESNPIGPIVQEYVEFLSARGHKAGPLHQYVFAVEHFGRWVGGRPIDHAVVAHFVERHLPRCGCGKPAPRHTACSRAALARLLEMLRVERPAEPGAVGDLLRSYQDHLRQVCGLAPTTIFYRLRYARELLVRLEVGSVRQLRKLSASLIATFVSAAGSRLKPSSGQTLASSIRSFLRFLLLRGLVHQDLATAVPSFANWRLASLPPTVSRDDLERLVMATDPSGSIGLRDRAALLCMVDLGLRASDVAAITTNGVDLDAGVIRFHRPKQRHQVELPMTRRLTVAIGLYLRRGRPLSAVAALFVKHRAPVGEPLKPIGIRGIVVRCASGASLADRIRGTHVIRHSVAAALINEGAAIKQIADLLGHQSIDTTALYAKVDMRSLKQVALAWPTADGLGERS